MVDYNYHGVVVVFDLDDTLFRERDYCRSGFRWIEKKLCKELGGGFHGVSRRMDTLLRRRDNYFELLERLLKLKAGERFADPEYLKEYMNTLVNGYRNRLPAYLPFAEGVKETLDRLQEQGVVMGLITDGRSGTQRAKIAALGLDKYIAPENIYISEEKGADKSRPESFQEIVRSYPEAKHFVYVGDNERKDFMMPNLMGWKTLKVPADFDNVHPVYITDDILQAPAVRMSGFPQILTEIKQ